MRFADITVGETYVYSGERCVVTAKVPRADSGRRDNGVSVRMSKDGQTYNGVWPGYLRSEADHAQDLLDQQARRADHARLAGQLTDLAVRTLNGARFEGAENGVLVILTRTAADELLSRLGQPPLTAFKHPPRDNAAAGARFRAASNRLKRALACQDGTHAALWPFGTSINGQPAAVAVLAGPHAIVTLLEMLTPVTPRSALRDLLT